MAKGRRLTGVVWLLMGLTGLARLAEAQEPLFKNGDRICFLGNSITSNGGFFHHVALFCATRYPDKELTFFNAGIGGNWTGDVIKRLDNDVISYRPDWCVVKLGMNDVNRNLYLPGSDTIINIRQIRQDALNKFRTNFETIIETLLKNKIKVILQTPSIYDQTARMASESLVGRNDALKVAAGYVKELGAKYGLFVVDYWSPMQEITERVQKRYPDSTMIGPDRVHPGPVGHFIMAYTFLSAMKFSEQVSETTVRLNGKSTFVEQVSNAKVSDLKIIDNGIRFKLIEKALPFPVMEGARDALKLVPMTDRLNKETLKFDGLLPGDYLLSIDGVDIGKYNDKELLKGINLAENENAPQHQQAARLLSLFQEYWMMETRLRSIRATEYYKLEPVGVFDLSEARTYFANERLKWTDTADVAFKGFKKFAIGYMVEKEAESELKYKMGQILRSIYKINKPVQHIFELREWGSPSSATSVRQLFLLMGQSNMAGRGEIDSIAMLTDHRIYSLSKDSLWVLARDPLHFDKKEAGVGPGIAFAREILECDRTAGSIGLVPCAVGGTSIAKWIPGVYDEITRSYPYDDAVKRIKFALKNGGTLKGILWHQGESDSHGDQFKIYKSQFDFLYNRMKQDIGLNLDTIPIIIGELGRFYTKNTTENQGKQIDSVLRDIAEEYPNIYCVSSEGLKDKGDSLHFNAPAARELGKRYAKAWKEMKKLVR